MSHALAVSDLVVCRAGMGTMSELAALGKPAIVIPIPGTHQEDNAAFFAAHGAIFMVDQRTLTPVKFIEAARDLLKDQARQKILSENIIKLMPSRAGARMAKEIINLYEKRKNQ